MDYHYENLWVDNSVAGLGIYPTENYGAASDYDSKQEIIYQHRLRSNIISLGIIKSPTKDAKHKLMAFKTSCDFNGQYYGAAIFFIVVKMVSPDARAGCYDIKKPN